MNILTSSDLAELFGNNIKSDCELLTMMAESAYYLSLDFQFFKFDSQMNEYCFIQSLIPVVKFNNFKNDLMFQIRNYKDIGDSYMSLVSEKHTSDKNYRELEFSRKNKRKW